MHKTHIFDQKKNNGKKNLKITDLTYPIFFRTVTGNKQLIFLGLIIAIINISSAVGLFQAKKIHFLLILDRNTDKYGHNI